jgi:hypothetical protein
MFSSLINKIIDSLNWVISQFETGQRGTLSNKVEFLLDNLYQADLVNREFLLNYDSSDNTYSTTVDFDIVSECVFFINLKTDEGTIQFLEIDYEDLSITDNKNVVLDGSINDYLDSEEEYYLRVITLKRTKIEY